MPSRIIDARAFHIEHKTAEMDTEVSTAHLLRDPTAILADNNYGAALAISLEANGAKVKGNILHVGDGLGDVGSSATAHWKNKEHTPIRADISLLLLKIQASKHGANSIGVQTDATNLPFKDGRFVGILANEIIADFPAIVSSHAELQMAVDGNYSSDITTLEAAKKYKTYDLALPQPDPQGNIYTNTGAFAFIEEAARVLEKKGWLFVSEFGRDNNEQGKSVAFKDPAGKTHTEVGINFSHLTKVAAQNGFNEMFNGKLADFLNIPADQWSVLLGQEHGFKVISPAEYAQDYKEKIPPAKFGLDYMGDYKKGSAVSKKHGIELFLDMSGHELSKDDNLLVPTAEVVFRNFYALLLEKD